jgi:dimethylhistidine N-methyltransferase
MRFNRLKKGNERMVSPSAVLAHAAPAFLARGSQAPSPEQAELRDGLLDDPAHIDPKFLYDALGSSLFTAITQLPEYYPTRCEAEIFQRHGADIARHVGEITSMIDLGAGDCVKAENLFARLRPRHYIPIDISADYLQAAVRRLRLAYPDLSVTAIGQDFSQTLALPSNVPADHRLFFYPGSSIGNLSPDDALAMLQRIRAQCDGGGLLVGVDRVKSKQVLEPAYDDALHLTAAFNLNLLRHVNTVLDTDFDVADWRHVALFNSQRSRIEMHLEAQRAVRVTWPGGAREFTAGERIHTENSYKFTPDAFTDLLQRAGFRDVVHWSDARGWFSVFSARA